jgi:hypothetical protein
MTLRTVGNGMTVGTHVHEALVREDIAAPAEPTAALSRPQR